MTWGDGYSGVNREGEPAKDLNTHLWIIQRAISKSREDFLRKPHLIHLIQYSELSWSDFYSSVSFFVELLIPCSVRTDQNCYIWAKYNIPIWKYQIWILFPLEKEKTNFSLNMHIYIYMDLLVLWISFPSLEHSILLYLTITENEISSTFSSKGTLVD